MSCKPSTVSSLDVTLKDQNQDKGHSDPRGIGARHETETGQDHGDIKLVKTDIGEASMQQIPRHRQKEPNDKSPQKDVVLRIRAKHCHGTHSTFFFKKKAYC